MCPVLSGCNPSLVFTGLKILFVTTLSSCILGNSAITNAHAVLAASVIAFDESPPTYPAVVLLNISDLTSLINYY